MREFEDKNLDPPSAFSVPETIAAISTPPGPGGIGVVRLSGPGSLEASSMIFTPLATTAPWPPEPKKALVGHVHAPGAPHERIDQAVLVRFAGPASYTGEDTVELTTHGGPLIMASLLEAAIGAGCRLAEPGEFTRQAFENGRMDLSQAEAVASLIYAATEGARKVMLRQVEGAMGRRASALREELLAAKIVVESAIDFPEDEDVADLDLESVRKSLAAGQEVAARLLATAREGIALNSGLSVAIIGTPNVGKSSLLNSLLEEERAIVHEVAGTTRDFVEGRIDIMGIPMKVVDTAGIREGADSVEIEGILRTRKIMEQADLVLVLLDGSREAGPTDRSLLEETAGLARVVVLNKSDLPQAPPEDDLEAVSVSALTGEGVGQLKSAIYNLYIGGEPTLAGADGVVTSVRQAEALRRVESSCSRAVAALEDGSLAEPELLAVDLDDALAGIGELTGEVTADEVLCEIFERFCIGK
jgi:tRNA modification GTPase